MKLIAVLLTVILLQLNVKGISQKVTISAKKAPWEEIFSSIKKQTGYVVFCNASTLAGIPPVTIEVRDMELKTFLDKILKGLPLEYLVKKDNVIISRRRGGRLEKTLDISEKNSVSIKGIVVDSIGNVLVGATVMNRNMRKTAVTSMGGAFNIDANEGDELIISYVGYEGKSIIVSTIMLSSADRFVITLSPSIAKLESVEVVSTGYQET